MGPSWNMTFELRSEKRNQGQMGSGREGQAQKQEKAERCRGSSKEAKVAEQMPQKGG